MLKYQIDSIEDLDESASQMYEEKDGKYLLKVDGLPDYEALKSEMASVLKNKNDLLDEKKKEQEKRKQQEEEARIANEKAAKEAGNIEALEASWAAKYEQLETTKNSELDKTKNAVTSTMLDSSAVLLASNISDYPEVLLPHIKSRLSIEMRDDKFVKVVKDQDGKPSALTLAELEDEYKNNPAFSAVIRKTGASGGGAGSNSKPASGAGVKSIKRSAFDSMGQYERSKFIKNGGKIAED